MAATEPALVLPSGALPDTGGVTFVGFPGVWYPDLPVAVSALGFGSAKDAEKAVKDLGLPLKAAKADVVADDTPAPEPEVVVGLPDGEGGDPS